MLHKFHSEYDMKFKLLIVRGMYFLEIVLKVLQTLISDCLISSNFHLRMIECLGWKEP